MKKTKQMMILIAAISISSVSNAQLGKMVKKAATNAATSAAPASSSSSSSSSKPFPHHLKFITSFSSPQIHRNMEIEIQHK